jgi:hypothetical protein
VEPIVCNGDAITKGEVSAFWKLAFGTGRFQMDGLRRNDDFYGWDLKLLRMFRQAYFRGLTGFDLDD